MLGLNGGNMRRAKRQPTDSHSTSNKVTGASLSTACKLPSQCTDEIASQSDELGIEGLRLRGEFCNHNLILGIDEEVLTVNAEAK
jgi:hypothetical protein